MYLLPGTMSLGSQGGGASDPVALPCDGFGESLPELMQTFMDWLSKRKISLFLTTFSTSFLKPEGMSVTNDARRCPDIYHLPLNFIDSVISPYDRPGPDRTDESFCIRAAGESEEWLGEWMKLGGNRDQLVIATKYHSAKDGVRKDGISSGLTSNLTLWILALPG